MCRSRCIKYYLQKPGGFFDKYVDLSTPLQSKMNPIQMMDGIQILFFSKKIYQILCFWSTYTYVGGYAQINIYVDIHLKGSRELLNLEFRHI